MRKVTHNAHTLTHTRENIPFKGTQTMGSLTKGGARSHWVPESSDPRGESSHCKTCFSKGDRLNLILWQVSFTPQLSVTCRHPH